MFKRKARDQSVPFHDRVTPAQWAVWSAIASNPEHPEHDLWAQQVCHLADPALVPLLVTDLASGDERRRRVALRALNAIWRYTASPQARTAQWQHVATTSHPKDIDEICGSMAIDLDLDPVPAFVWPAVLTVLTTPKHPALYAVSRNVAHRCDSREVSGALISLAHTGSPVIALHALNALRWHASPTVSARVLPFLEHKNGDTRACALQVIARDATQDVPQVILDHPAVWLRSAAWETASVLAEHGDQRNVPHALALTLKLLKKPSGELVHLGDLLRFLSRFDAVPRAELQAALPLMDDIDRDSVERALQPPRPRPAVAPMLFRSPVPFRSLSRLPKS